MESKNCFICKDEAEVERENGDARNVECKTCSSYKISALELRSGLAERLERLNPYQRATLQSIIKSDSEFGDRTKVTDTLVMGLSSEDRINGV